MRALFVLILLLLSAPGARACNHGETRGYFEDWLTACRPDGYCSATTYVNPRPANGTAADYILRIGRPAEQTYWEISFSAIATDANLRTTFTVGVDGTDESFTQPDGVAAYGSINDFYFLGDAAQTLMDRMVPGRAVTVGFTDSKNAAEKATFSLSGIGAALMWIDTQQHRIGSERVAGAPPYGLVRPNQPYLAWMMPALDVFQ